MNIKKAGQVLLTRAKDVERYALILELYKNSSIVDDNEFQRKFNAFYRVRRGAEWRAAFYEIFAREKGSTPSFATILNEIYQKTGNIEGSFTSKLLATINPNLPIWDQYVLKNIGLKVKETSKEEKLKNAVELYGKMVDWYSEFLDSADGQQCIAEFDKCFPQYGYFSEIKKADFILWCSRD